MQKLHLWLFSPPPPAPGEEVDRGVDGQGGEQGQDGGDQHPATVQRPPAAG